MICHLTKCVFIHIPKTAGQSIEHVFLENAGLDWESREPMLLRENTCSRVGPPRLSHLLGSEYVKYRYLSQELFDNYFKFAIVRDPWARTASFYHYMGYANKMSFKKFVRLLPAEMESNKRWFIRPQADYVYSKNGELLVDYVGRFEALQNSLDVVLGRLNIPLQHLPHINKINTKKRNSLRIACRKLERTLKLHKAPEKYKDYSHYYDSETIELVSSVYKADIEKFGYRFAGRI